MSSSTADGQRASSRITHGSLVVLAYLHETDAACSQVARETPLAESTVWQWLTDLDEAGIIEGEATRSDDGRAVVEYHLDDHRLGAAARHVVDRLYTGEVDPDPSDKRAPTPDADD